MLIKKLADTDGPPSWEDGVREAIRGEIAGYVDDLYADRLGNLYAGKNTGTQGMRIALSAHMDEAGMVVTFIEKSGALKFACWGADERAIVSKPVRIGKNSVRGVIGHKPIHLQEPGEKEGALDLAQLYVDIGADSDQEAQQYVSIGDYIAFDSSFHEFGDNKIKAKALDGREGCAAVVEILKSGLPYALTAVFTTQELVGSRGAETAASRINADVLINLNAFTCAGRDDCGDSPGKVRLGMGPVITLADEGSVFLRRYANLALAAATARNVPIQLASGKGNTAASRYHTARGGMPVIGLGIPVRYPCSPASVADTRDYEHLLILLREIIIRLNEGQVV